nr:ribosomal protein L32 [Microheliella maris]
MALPKKKITPRRKRLKKTNRDRLNLTFYTICQKCNKIKRPHFYCIKCNSL